MKSLWDGALDFARWADWNLSAIEIERNWAAEKKIQQSIRVANSMMIHTCPPGILRMLKVVALLPRSLPPSRSTWTPLRHTGPTTSGHRSGAWARPGFVSQSSPSVSKCLVHGFPSLFSSRLNFQQTFLHHVQCRMFWGPRGGGVGVMGPQHDD